MFGSSFPLKKLLLGDLAAVFLYPKAILRYRHFQQLQVDFPGIAF